ncbi:MAG TPA: glycosyltransferase family 2 protein [Edaphocola sp.]|nr:glycosyltransferase family 2 protein [Edaphocola sp.]
MQTENKPFYSIIIPVYNSGLFLDNCLESIINQDFLNFELIIIDDGSEDNSLEISKSWQMKDSRVKVLTKKNGGQGSARNLGLKIAVGTYVLFVDSDDALSETTLSKNYEILKQDPEIDCLQFPIYRNYGKENAFTKENEVCTFTNTYEITIAFLKNNKLTWIFCDKIFKRTLFDHLAFREDIKYEDNYLIMKMIPAFKKIYSSNKGMYYYYYRENSTTTSSLSEHKEVSTIQVLLLIMDVIRPLKDIELIFKYLIRIINVEKSLKANFNSFTPEFKQFKNDMRFKDIVFSNQSIKNKIKLLQYKYV